MTHAHARTLAALAATPLLLQACGSSEPTTMTDATESGSPMTGGSTTAPTTGAADVSGTTGVASTTTGGGETTFLCGDTLTCELAYQYCLIETGPNSTSYYCEAMPAECIETHDCACLAVMIVNEGCSDNPDGGVTLYDMIDLVTPDAVTGAAPAAEPAGR